MDEQETKNRPVFHKRLGSVRVAVFENSTDGKPWYNTTVMRRYTKNDQPRETPNLTGLGDLALAAAGIRMAQTWIEKREVENQGNAND